MAMKMTTGGIGELEEIFKKLGNQAENVARVALYEGADIMADAYKNAPAKIRTEKFRGKREKRLPSPEEKAAVTGKSGIAKFRKGDGEISTMVGIGNSAGYVMLGNSRRAVKQIANSINSGTSFMDKQPIFRRASTQNRKPAQEAIVERAEELLEAIINGKTQEV